MLAVNDKAIKLVKDDLETTHARLFVKPLEVKAIEAVAALEDDRPIVGEVDTSKPLKNVPG